MGKKLPQKTLLFCILWGICVAAFAGEVRIAVASNFMRTMQAIVVEFESEHDHRVITTFGSSGRLYAQILHGAPFDIFFSADQLKPAAIVKANLALAGSVYTYAQGSLVLWCGYCAGKAPLDILKGRAAFTLAKANPKLAPYGAAANQALTHLPIAARQFKTVEGENINQVFQFVQSGNATLGFVALSQVLAFEGVEAKNYWLVPTTFYLPILQDAVVIKRADASKAAVDAFMAFLGSNKVKTLMEAHGYKASP